jgi:type IV pilus assembly protein PilV
MNRSMRSPGTSNAGFTLIEVLIALVVLAFGLLGFAMLQTMNVRFVESANYRSQATNLGYEILDQVRANRISASSYVGTYTGTTTGCAEVNSGKLIGVSTPETFKSAWQCRAGMALGDGAKAAVSLSGKELTVDVSWGDDRWVQNATDTHFQAKTQL